ncbi:hypothetical protein [Roseimicrobium sp. ORNL1]|uniref:hypothetical protein n=1 Tax=Roseimicrobium sp. ORNL1 TaxID=2711231 RepID=UPI0013E0F85A|nr:hypothetical protein [Roseimicrobium sp. ORNL1]QIF00905.1 hypothetical protein G5S37_05010 [Roseimicrobium sp. ORNL1]
MAAAASPLIFFSPPSVFEESASFCFPVVEASEVDSFLVSSFFATVSLLVPVVLFAEDVEGFGFGFVEAVLLDDELDVVVVAFFFGVLLVPLALVSDAFFLLGVVAFVPELSCAVVTEPRQSRKARMKFTTRIFRVGCF